YRVSRVPLYIINNHVILNNKIVKNSRLLKDARTKASMKQTLQLKLSQHLTLTPQLQQSIRLLQLSTVELNAEVERMLQENPLLEKADGEDESPLPGAVPAGSTIVPDKDPRAERKDDADAPSDRASDERREIDGVDRSDFEDYSSGDSDWGSASGTDDDDGFFPQQVATNSLRDHLLRQLAELKLPLRDRQIVASLIDALDDDGYLHSSLEEI